MECLTSSCVALAQEKFQLDSFAPIVIVRDPVSTSIALPNCRNLASHHQDGLPEHQIRVRNTFVDMKESCLKKVEGKNSLFYYLLLVFPLKDVEGDVPNREVD